MYCRINTVLIYYCLLTLIRSGIYHLADIFALRPKSELKKSHPSEKFKSVGKKDPREKYQLKKRDSKKETQKKELKKILTWILLER